MKKNRLKINVPDLPNEKYLTAAHFYLPYQIRWIVKQESSMYGEGSSDSLFDQV